MRIFPNFTTAIMAARQQLIDVGITVHGDQWQSIDISKKPEMVTREILNFSFQVQVTNPNLKYLRKAIEPNLPWADDHFEERVGGEPLNPGVQWAKWPWGNSADKFRGEQGQFSHTYMERFWPKIAGQTEGGKNPISCGACGTPYAQCDTACVEAASVVPRLGIRYRYGDLNDVVDHLAAHPLSRQAYLPIWFPEDTGVTHKERVPCTLGYYFILRNGYFHTIYTIRSCDIVRHFQDDIYLAVRLQLWMLEKLRKTEQPAWQKVIPGFFTMHIYGLHMFKADVQKYVKDGKWVS